MKSIIIKPKNELLKRHVQYFLFFKKSGNEPLHYTTFPNNNLCLAIYKENTIHYNNVSSQNNCIIASGNKNFTSRFYGFHKMPFTVDINSSLDQICIIFNPSALRAFSSESYENLISSDSAFDIFTSRDDYALEQLFEEVEFQERAEQLEQLLLKNLKYTVPDKLKEALHLVSTYNSDNLTVEILAKKLQVSTPTLFRLFKNHLGQNPKSYLKTIRFRNTLDEILNKQNTLTNIAYVNQFYDQAHFVHDFKTFSGYSPKQLFEKVSVQQNDLAWIYNKK